MRYYSTKNKSRFVSLQQAVTQGLASDNGLYMPEKIPLLPEGFFKDISQRSFQENAFEVAKAFIEDDVPNLVLRQMIDNVVDFDAPLVEVEEGVFSLELFHGPTQAFKDFGARFMSQLLGFFAQNQQKESVILVATSGDTGSAVANGFLGVEGTKVIVLYPAGKVSDIQEKQFTTLGKNITALEIEGTFDDCQSLVKQSFLDQELQKKLNLTSANSINIARLIPQSFYYFHAYAQLKHKDLPVVMSVPSGNFGNLTAGLMAQKMGLPVDHFIAATNVNDIVPHYLSTQLFAPKASVSTISNAMDVGNPSNFARMMDLFNNEWPLVRKHIVGYAFTDEETQQAMREVYKKEKYVLDPHGAIGYLGLKKYRLHLQRKINGIFLETAHPAKFKEVVDAVLETNIAIPEKLKQFMGQEKRSIKMPADFKRLKDWMMAFQ